MKKKLTTLLLAATLFVTVPHTQSYAAECTEHRWSNWNTTVLATCSNDGLQERFCIECYKEEKISIPATGHHTWGEWLTNQKPACETSGSKLRMCEECFETEEENLPAIGHHTWKEWRTLYDSTCGENGLKSRECTVCFNREEKEIPATKHHTWGKWESAKKATALSEGMNVRYCEECNKKETKAIPKLKAKISLKEKSVTVEIGKSHTIKIKSKTHGDKVKEWISSDKNIATITSSGKVQGKQEGIATITLQMESGVKATCKIQVIKSARSNTVPASGSGNNSSHSGSSGSNSSTGHVNPPASGYVWIPNTGSKYHRSGTCGRMKNPRQVPLQDAIHAGYEPCSRCS